MQSPLVALESIQIASPCRAEWNAMQPVRGQDCIRFCQSCGKNVYDLSGFTRDEAIRLMEEKEGRLCLRIHKRSDGTVITSDCPVGSASVRKRGQIAVVFAAVAGLGAAVFGIANVLIQRLPVAPKMKIPTPASVTSSLVVSPKQEMVRVAEKAPVEATPIPPHLMRPMPVPPSQIPDGAMTTTMGAPMPPMPEPTPAVESSDKVSEEKPIAPFASDFSR